MPTSTVNLPELKINYLSQAQYNTALNNGQINSDEIYLTPDNKIIVSSSNASNPTNYEENSLWLKYGDSSEGWADWVVETGITGMWTWRKWASGIAECWGNGTIATAADQWETWGNIYISKSGSSDNNRSYWTYPTGLFTATPVAHITPENCSSQAAMGLYYYNYGSSTRTCNIAVVRPNIPAGEQTVTVSITAKGTWK